MLIDVKYATEIFKNTFIDRGGSPYLHPFYIIADSKRDANLSPHFFLFKEGAEVFYYAFHLSPVPGETDLFDIQSPYGYGGPISTTGNEDFLHSAWKDFSQWCKGNNVLAEFVRFHPFLENYRIFPGETVYDRDVVCINLTPPDIFKAYSPRARTAIRKAQKNGLEVEWYSGKQFLPIFRDIYLDRMQKINADHFYFFSDAYFHELMNWNHSHLTICSLNGEPLAAAIFLSGNAQMEYHLSAATSEGKALSATNLIIHEAAIRAKILGCTQLNLGGGTDSSTDNPLFCFKSSFSTLRAPFYIGKRVHMEHRYQALKFLWKKENRPLSNRILFYR